MPLIPAGMSPLVVPAAFGHPAPPPLLDPEHVAKLASSGLSTETIARARVYTERDLNRLRNELNNPSVDQVPALVFPFFDRGGKQTDYCAVRMLPPVKRMNGKEAKYLMPRGEPSRAYFPPFEIVKQAIREPGRIVMITEGVAKALAATQAGVPCIGLMGMWNWVVKESNPRRLIPGLAGVAWRGKTVLVVPDFDPKRKPTVYYGAAELSRVLCDLGADVRIPRLPQGPRGKDGLPQKNAIDDWIVRLGDAGFRLWVEEELADPPLQTLDDWRRAMLVSRMDAAAGSPTVYLDRSPPGAGKSHADGMVLVSSQGRGDKANAPRTRSLTMLPTHANCREAVEEYARLGVKAEAYPQLTTATCVRYDEATAVLGRGLPFTKVLCQDCPHRPECPYWGEMELAKSAIHAVATHARGTLADRLGISSERVRQGLNELVEARRVEKRPGRGGWELLPRPTRPRIR